MHKKNAAQLYFETCFCAVLQNRRPSVYLPTREYPSEQSKYQTPVTKSSKSELLEKSFKLKIINSQ